MPHSLPKSLPHQSAPGETHSKYYSSFPMKIVTLQIDYLYFSIKSKDDYMKISCRITISSSPLFLIIALTSPENQLLNSRHTGGKTNKKEQSNRLDLRQSCLSGEVADENAQKTKTRSVKPDTFILRQHLQGRDAPQQKTLSRVVSYELSSSLPIFSVVSYHYFPSFQEKTPSELRFWEATVYPLLLLIYTPKYFRQNL